MYRYKYLGICTKKLVLIPRYFLREEFLFVLQIKAVRAESHCKRMGYKIIL